MSKKALFPVFAALFIGLAMAVNPAAAEPKFGNKHHNEYSQGHKGKAGYGWHGGYHYRSNVYIVPFAEYRRFIHRHGHHAVHSWKFKRFVRHNGRPVMFPRWHYRQTHSGYGYSYGHPQWVYVNLATGRIWR